MCDGEVAGCVVVRTKIAMRGWVFEEWRVKVRQARRGWTGTCLKGGVMHVFAISRTYVKVK